MPEEHYTWLPRSDILTFEELSYLVDAFMETGVDRVRLTGGEPLLRRDLPVLVEMLAAKSGLSEIALTTNAVLLRGQAKSLRDAGLNRVTISLDTLQPQRFRSLTRRDEHQRALDGIDAARAAGLAQGLKINTVVMRGTNDDELAEMVAFGRSIGAEVRFIEYMDVGGATHWSQQQLVSKAEILRRLADHYGEIIPAETDPAAPAGRYQLSDGTVFGIVASTTEPFCRTCDRARLTADGMWLTCLYATEGTDLRTPLRAGASRRELRERIQGIWGQRSDRGAEQRLELRAQRGPLVQLPTLKSAPHLEMHTRGG